MPCLSNFFAKIEHTEKLNDMDFTIEMSQMAVYCFSLRNSVGVTPKSFFT